MTERIGTIDELRRQVQRLIGQRAWNSRAGSSTGSIFTLQVGLPLEEERNRGEFDLMVFCAWRITDEQNRLVCSWQEDGDLVLTNCLASLHDAEIARANTSDWGDLHLSFSNGRNLHVFADLPGRKEVQDCWSVRIGKDHFSWSSDSEVCVEIHG